MSQKPETVFRAKVDVRLKSIPNSWFESIQQRAIHGTPDKIGCVNGWFVALEIKADENSPVTALQEHKLMKIADANGMGVVVRPSNLDNTIEMLMHLAKEKKC